MSDYPTEGDLKAIRTWELKEREDYIALAKFVCNIWHWPNFATLTWKAKKVDVLRLVTGGWSGNEDIVGALQENQLFGMVCWKKSERGGVHIYEIPELKKGKVK